MAGDDYGWLYPGRDPRSVPAGDPNHPEATRKIEVSAATPSAIAPTPANDPAAHPANPHPAQRGQANPGQARPGAIPDGGAAPPRKRRRRPRVRTMVLLALLGWLTFMVITPLLAWKNVSKVEWEPATAIPDTPGTNYLMVGSDSRAGLSKAERAEYHTGDAGSQLSDTIMLLHTGSGPNLLLSFTRDTVVDIPGCGSGKINSAYSCGGAPKLTQTVEQLTGIHVDHYVEIGMGGVAGIVDAVGGIEICPKTNMNDPLAGLNIKKGCQTVDGKTALAYSRSRHVNPLSDLGRVQQQREVVAAVGDKVLSPWTFINPVRWWRLNHAVPEFFAFGEGTGPVSAGRWALAMAKTPKSCTIPLANGSAAIDPQRSAELFGLIAADKTDDIPKRLCTATGLAP